MKEKNFYVCDVCGQSYKYISPFLYHKKVHEGKKDFVSSTNLFIEREFSFLFNRFAPTVERSS